MKPSKQMGFSGVFGRTSLMPGFHEKKPDGIWVSRLFYGRMGVYLTLASEPGRLKNMNPYFGHHFHLPRNLGGCIYNSKLGGGFKYFWCFHPYLGKMNPFWRAYFWNGLKPPTSKSPIKTYNLLCPSQFKRRVRCLKRTNLTCDGPSKLKTSFFRLQEITILNIFYGWTTFYIFSPCFFWLNIFFPHLFMAGDFLFLWKCF